MNTSNINDLATRAGIAPEIAEKIYQEGFQTGKLAALGGMKPNAADIRLGLHTYEAAFARGLSLSAYLEEIDPSDQYNDGLDAFERQLMLAGIRTKSDPAAGVYADRVERFFTADHPNAKYLFPEFINRVWRKASLGGFGPEVQHRFYASSEPVSDVLYPPFIQRLVRQKQIAPAIPLAELVAIVTNIDSGVYKAFYLTDASDEYTMRRVAEGAEVPTAKLTGGDHTINLKKYGRRLLGSYETFRRMQIDRFALHIALLAVKAEADKVSTVIDVIVNGDGNSGTAATNHDLTDLDGDAVAGTLTLKGYLNWLMQWTNPYRCNTVLARAADALQVLLLNMGSANVPYFMLAGNFGIGGVTPLNNTLDGVRIGWTSDAPSLKLVGIDNRFAVEMVTEVGASITETDKIIRQQMNEIAITETVGFCILDANANKTLDINA